MENQGSGFVLFLDGPCPRIQLAFTRNEIKYLGIALSKATCILNSDGTLHEISFGKATTFLYSLFPQNSENVSSPHPFLASSFSPCLTVLVHVKVKNFDGYNGNATLLPKTFVCKRFTGQSMPCILQQ